MRASASWWLLALPVLIFVASFITNAIPGALTGIYLVGILSCIPAMALARPWPKGISMALAVLFVALSFEEIQRGIDTAFLKGVQLEHQRSAGASAKPGS